MPENLIVHVIDDDDAARQSLEFLIKSARLRVQAHESAQNFLNALPTLNPGCIITDVRMPGLSGIDLLKRLKAAGKTIPVIVITGHGDVALAVEAMKVGAADFLEKPFDDDILLAAVRSALNRLEQNGRRDSELSKICSCLAALSNREHQVLEGLVAGKPNKKIAFDLAISPRTVEIYRANVMTKMGADSLSDLVRMALVAGILDASR